MDDFIRRVPLVGAGFLLAVLWFDPMFDTQVAGEPDGVLREPVLSSIAILVVMAIQLAAVRTAETKTGGEV